MNRFVKVVDDFMKKRVDLLSASDDVRLANDPALTAAYNRTVSQADALKSTIEFTTGTWQQAKQMYADVIDTTSMDIGDAIDEIRSWFGYDPSGGLGIIQLPAAVWVAGIIAAALIVNKSMNEILIRVEATRLQRETGMSRDRAIKVAKDAYSTNLFDNSMIPLVLIGGIALLYFSSKQRG